MKYTIPCHLAIAALLAGAAVCIQAAPALAQASPDSTEYRVSEGEWPARTYIGVKDTVAFSAIGGFFEKHFHALYQHVQQVGGDIQGPPSGLYWSWDEQDEVTVMSAAIPVAGAEEVDSGDYDRFDLPEGRALSVDYFGPYEGTGAAHEALAAFMEGHGYGQPVVAIEEYITDPGAEPDTSKWLTRVHYVFQ